jgi:polyferredoxin
MAKLIETTLIEDPPGSFYEAERKVYPRDVHGRWARLRKLAVFVLLGAFYLLPWLAWDGRQAVLFDLPARRFHVLGLTFWPQDFFLLALLLIIAGLSLFFFTALAGRLWCGYACPQTVWTEVFLWIERWTEGDRSQRIRLDQAPWSAGKLRRKGAKHVLWLLLALWTGFTFVGFFTPIRELGANLAPFAWSGWETFWVSFYALATWGNAGVLREQVCKYMCPYARFQSAMFDRNTLIISYDAMRGEPRGARRRGLPSVLARARGLLGLEPAIAAVAAAAQKQSAASARVHANVTTALVAGDTTLAPRVAAAEDLGDCIDCTLCVQVCPTGIDIRNGLQYECIACGACIDACDQVMDKLGYPAGLIRYTTQNAVEGRPTRVLRPRVWAYGVLLLGLLGGWGWGVATRAPLLAEVLRDRNALYRVAADGAIENAYQLKLVNKTGEAQRYRIALDGAAPVALVHPVAAEILLGPESVESVALTLRAPAGTVSGRRAIVLVVQPLSGAQPALRVESAFFGPAP